MGRWGKKIYDSDTALDFFDRFTRRLEAEMAYWTAPEQVFQTSMWLGKVLTIAELMLMFEQNEMGSAPYLIDQQPAIKRWQETIFNVWDAIWNDGDRSFPYCDHSYRLQHRSVLSQLFARLDYLAEPSDGTGNSEAQSPSLDVKLPFFSIAEHQIDSGGIYVHSDWLIEHLLEELMHTVVFIVSEKIEPVTDWLSDGLETMWVAVDVIGFLCEAYARSPRISYDTAVNWQKIMEKMWEDGTVIPPGYDLAKLEGETYTNVTRSFDRLKSFAKQYPPWFAKEK